MLLLILKLAKVFFTNKSGSSKSVDPHESKYICREKSCGKSLTIAKTSSVEIIFVTMLADVILFRSVPPERKWCNTVFFEQYNRIATLFGFAYTLLGVLKVGFSLNDSKTEVKGKMR